MTKITIDPSRCTQCGHCAWLCPSEILVRDAATHTIEVVRSERCIGCGHCVAACPADAIRHPAFPDKRIHPIDRAILPSPAAVLELIRSRRSNRALTSKPIPEEALAQIVEAARYAPTASNEREVGITLITDPAQLQRIADFTVNTFHRTARLLLHPAVRWLVRLVRPDLDRYARRFAAIRRRHEEGRDPILRKTSALLVIHTPAKSRFGTEDANLACQNASLLAESLGVSQIYMGFILMAWRMGNRREFARITAIDGVPRALLALGMPAFRFPKYVERW